MKEKLKLIGVLILFLLGIMEVYFSLNKDFDNAREIGEIKYSSSIGIDNGTNITYHILKKDNELYYRKDVSQITIEGETEEMIQEQKEIQNIDELKTEIEKRKKTDEEFFYQKIVIKYIINNKEIDENEFWNKIDKIKEQLEV